MTLHFPIGVARPLVVSLAAVAMLTIAHAHGPAQWIQSGNYKNAAGELCCGERDCFELTDADVKITSSGYYVVSIKETIPFSEATPHRPAPIGAASGAGRGSASSHRLAQPELTVS